MRRSRGGGRRWPPGITGVRTTVPFPARVLESAAVRAARVHTPMVEGGAFDA